MEIADSTVNIDSDIEIEEPPSPTPLERMQDRHQAYLRWCAAMLEASVSDQRAVHRQLTRARQRHVEASRRLEMTKSVRAVVAKVVKKRERELSEANSKCSKLIEELDSEDKWRPPSVIMSQEHQEALKHRVDVLKELLRKKQEEHADI